jgi:hypothetical protein
MDSMMMRPEGDRVEVSGWDQAGDFFVEETALDCPPGGQKTVQIQSAVRQGCVLFVRELQPDSIVRNLPVPHQAQAVTELDAQGRMRVSLLQMQPRVRFRESLQSENSPTINDDSVLTPFS